MSQAIIPLKGSGFPKLTTKSVVAQRDNTSTGNSEELRQNYVDRIRGYVPVEVVAFYVFVNSLISDNVLAGESQSLTADGYVAVIATLFGLAGTVIYVRLTTRDENISAWKTTAMVALFAFCIWIYAMDAKVFEVLELDVIPSVSGLLLASFTLFAGVIVPTTKDHSEKTAGTLIDR